MSLLERKSALLVKSETQYSNKKVAIEILTEGFKSRVPWKYADGSNQEVWTHLNFTEVQDGIGVVATLENVGFQELSEKGKDRLFVLLREKYFNTAKYRVLRYLRVLVDETHTDLLATKSSFARILVNGLDGKITSPITKHIEVHTSDQYVFTAICKLTPSTNTCKVEAVVRFNGLEILLENNE